MRKRIVVLNGPPGSGKDYMGRQLAKFMGFELMKFAKPMDDALRGMFDIKCEDTWQRLRETEKNEPQRIFNGFSTREVLIDFSEVWAKPLFGQKVFGRLAAKQVGKSNSDLIAFTDSGFQSEFEEIVDTGADVVVVRLYRSGCSYQADSRGYLDVPQKTIDVQNYGDLSTVEYLLRKVKEWIRELE